MAKKYTVQVVPHTHGLNNYHSRWRAGRQWLSEAVTIEVIDQDDDPPADASGVIRVGRRSLALLQSDEPYLKVTPA